MPRPAADLGRPLDYAPPPRRPAWVNGRTVMIAVLVIAAGLAAWVVVPRVSQRAELLALQRRVARGTHAGTWLAVSRAGDTLSAANASPRDAGLYLAATGGRPVGVPLVVPAPAGPGTDKRLLVLQIQHAIGARNEPAVAIHWSVVSPATWLRSPAVLGSGVAGPAGLPFPQDGRLILTAAPDASDSSRIVVLAEHDPAPGLVPADESGVGRPEFRPASQAFVHLWLMADATVRVDWPTAAEPVGHAVAQPATSPGVARENGEAASAVE